MGHGWESRSLGACFWRLYLVPGQSLCFFILPRHCEVRKFPLPPLSFMMLYLTTHMPRAMSPGTQFETSKTVNQTKSSPQLWCWTLTTHWVRLESSRKHICGLYEDVPERVNWQWKTHPNVSGNYPVDYRLDWIKRKKMNRTPVFASLLWPAVLHACCHGFPTMVDCILHVWAKHMLFHPWAVLVRYAVRAVRKLTDMAVFYCFLSCFITAIRTNTSF